MRNFKKLLLKFNLNSLNNHINNIIISNNNKLIITNNLKIIIIINKEIFNRIIQIRLNKIHKNSLKLIILYLDFDLIYQISIKYFIYFHKFS